MPSIKKPIRRNGPQSASRAERTRHRGRWFPMLCCFGLTGCGTLHSLSGPMRSAPCVYSGVRLDWAILQDDEHYLQRYQLTAPDHPAVDLPVSFAADSVLLPFSLFRAGYQTIFVPAGL